MKKTIISSLIGLSFATSIYAAENIELDEVTVKANRFEQKDTETTYASEIHTAKQIEASGATTLVDYLAQQTSLNILSNFGSKATPSINLRGFGNENGSQNVVITLDGQRLNNIDGSSQLLSAIPLGNIERIEISKGSGSVIYGDGATAGAIQIYTKHKTGVTVSTSLGNDGQQNHYLNAGISEQYFDLSASLAHDSHDGFSNKDPSGHRDEFTSNTQNVKLAVKPVEGLRVFAGATNSRNDIRYVSPLTFDQFKDNPRNVGLNSFTGNPTDYTHQGLSSEQWKIGGEYKITNEVKLAYIHYQEDKKSNFINFNSVADYDYSSNDLALSFENEKLSAIVGYQNFDGDRKGSSDTTTKNNQAVFVSGEYHLMDALTLSAGARSEKVEYRFTPTIGTSLSDSKNLSAWDIGANYRINNETTVFANYNQAFQAPDIDRFFTQDFSLFPIVSTSFNGFIKPEKVNTLNIGLNHTIENNRLKVTAFYAKLHDEMFLLKPFFFNRNLDKSHKYGIEIQDTFKFNDALSASLIYDYTRAIVDSENDDGNHIQNKNLPGAPKHTVVANLNYHFLEHANLNINHTWRSGAYAYDDFQNNFSQKQGQYNSTNVALNYQYKNFNVFTSISNLFEHANSIQVANDAIYPVDFARTWRVGVRVDF